MAADRLAEAAAPVARKRRLFFIHIGKTGGTAINAMLDDEQARDLSFRVITRKHRFTLAGVCGKYPNARVFFMLRDPVDRFVSGFLSRLRKGQPRYSSDWSEAERRAFETFPTPDALGRALAVDDPAAVAAVAAIDHIRWGYAHFLGGVDTLKRFRKNIAFIGAQETFDTDIARLKALLGMDERVMPPTDDVAAHRTPVEFDKTLSPEGRAGIEAFLAGEYDIYRWCLRHRERLVSRQERATGCVENG